MIDRNHPGFNDNAEPFFTVVMKGLASAVDGPHFWDAVAHDAVFEFIYTFPDFTPRIEGRSAYMDWFANYSIVLHSADALRAYQCAEPADVIVLEYEVHGAVSSTGKPYHNRFCSIVTIRDRQIIHWRDYMDGVAALRALTAYE
jgi:uncharacterized protein